ncbi:MAG: elongation factor P [Dehalococcoidia bacterium]
MISTGDLKKGVVIEMDGAIYQITDWEHIKVGRGSAQVRLKLRDLRAGHTLEKTFQAGSKFRRIRIDRRPMQYLYAEGPLRYFMDRETYEQTPLNADQVGDALQYLAENGEADILFVGDEPIGVELAAAVTLRVTQSEPGLRGDTQSAATKPATLETGLTINVPLFIEEGDLLKIDTRTGAYLERAAAAS